MFNGAPWGKDAKPHEVYSYEEVAAARDAWFKKIGYRE
jgi:hypothetical protein